MISVSMRILLVVGSLGTIFLMLRSIRRSSVQLRDSIFWILFSVILLILSIFPQLAMWAAQLLGIASPINFVYLCIIFLLLVQQFFSSIRISQLDAKLKVLVQKMAITEALGQETDGQKKETNTKQ